MRAVLAILFTLSSFFAQGRISFVDVEDLNTWEKMFKLAEQQNLNVLLYVDFVSCDDCRQLRKTTFKDKELKQFVKQNMLPLRVSAVNDLGQALAEVYDLKDVPMLYLMNTKEVLFFKHQGYIDALTLKKELTQNQNRSKEYYAWQRKASIGEDMALDEWIAYLEIEALNMRIGPKSKAVYEASIRLTQDDFKKKDVLSFVENLCIDTDGPVFQTLVEHPEWITDTTAFSWEAYQENVFNYNINRAIVISDSVLLEDILFQINKLEVTGGIENLFFRGRQLYLAELKQWAAYDTLTRARLDSLPVDSVNEFEIEAMQLMVNYTQESKAQAIALSYLRDGLKKKETFELYYALCLWLYNEYDYVNAYKAGYRAYELSETDEEKNLVKRLLISIENDY